MRTRKKLMVGSAAVSLAVVLAVALLSPPGLTGQSRAHQLADGAAVARLVDGTGGTLGFAWLDQERDDRVTVQVSARNLPPGFHGFHIHERGECATPDFQSASGHFNPQGTDHPDHAGDLPVLLVSADGTAAAAFDSDRFTVAELLDEDGSALIIHSGPDNLANIPERYGGPDEETLASGDSGSRIACGVISSIESLR